MRLMVLASRSTRRSIAISFLPDLKIVMVRKRVRAFFAVENTVFFIFSLFSRGYPGVCLIIVFFTGDRQEQKKENGMVESAIAVGPDVQAVGLRHPDSGCYDDNESGSHCYVIFSLSTDRQGSFPVLRYSSAPLLPLLHGNGKMYGFI
jgi:hypothetical protein